MREERRGKHAIMSVSCGNYRNIYINKGKIIPAKDPNNVFCLLHALFCRTRIQHKLWALLAALRRSELFWELWAEMVPKTMKFRMKKR